MERQQQHKVAAGPVLVLGASGRIGSVLRVVWPQGAGRWQTRGSPVPGGVLCDPLADPEGLAHAAQGCRAVLCLAGPVPGPGVDLGCHVPLARAAVEAGAAAGVPVLLASSAAVYGAQDGLLGEATPPMPISAYAKVKCAMEQEGQACGARLGVSVTALRIGNIAGLDAILGGWQPGFQLDRFEDGTTPARSYIGVKTLAQSLLRLAHIPDLPPVLNIAAPGVVQMGALLDAAGLAWHPRVAPPEAIPAVALDVTRLTTFVPLAPDAGLAHRLVAEWHGMEGT